MQPNGTLLIEALYLMETRLKPHANLIKCFQNLLNTSLHPIETLLKPTKTTLQRNRTASKPYKQPMIHCKTMKTYKALLELIETQ